MVAQLLSIVKTSSLSREAKSLPQPTAMGMQVILTLMLAIAF